ncbi:MAG: RagB/SusD family nutrient uptake outer membrane protein [Bacteroidales bacterium]|jgi:hypothetical protein|nr:RagB/SusD family nutrient uptake outer membrane protein [Bacteroidales bacterium]
MKQNIKIILLSLITLSVPSCEDFLTRPTEDSYNVDNFFQTDEQCFQAVNPIYNSPWYDFQRFFIKAGEQFSGNIYANGAYQTFTVNSSDPDLGLASASLWSVNAYCNSVIENINTKTGEEVSEQTKLIVKGEALVWKAMAYFYLVRTFGEVPVVHNNSTEIADGTYNDVYKAKRVNVYDYIILTLEQAIQWLPPENQEGRLDRYSAYALLAKVYLTKAGLSGTLNNDDLQKAYDYAVKVIDESGRELMPVFSDIFRLQNNFNREALISWHWKAGRTPWTQQNSLQSDLGIKGFDEWPNVWGNWTGPSVDLQDAFGESALSLDRNNRDTRRKATMMMYGDHYDYFWTTRGGFDWWNSLVKSGGQDNMSAVGTNCVKHLVGDNADHKEAGGGDTQDMANGLSTHLLRLADVYLICAEASALLNGGTTTDAKALEAFNKVFLRAIPAELPKTSITWEQIWKERRLELACEGDRWYDYVRWHYYAPQQAIAEIKAQRRAAYTGLYAFYDSGSLNPAETFYDTNPTIPNVTDESFTMPVPDSDLTMNPHLLEPGRDIDVSQYKY